jgi:hypothetical protein
MMKNPHLPNFIEKESTPRKGEKNPKPFYKRILQMSTFPTSKMGTTTHV